MTNKKGMLVILSAPSGCGKDTIFRAVGELRNDTIESISATTRKPRVGEVDGVNYFFKTDTEFRIMIANDELLEYAIYNDCYYGTPINGVKKAINEGKICFLIIDVQGAQRVLDLMPDAISIFLLPPSIEELRSRLKGRNQNDDDDIDRRIDIAKMEIEMSKLYKYTVVNDDIQKCANRVNEIIDKELLSVNN